MILFELCRFSFCFSSIGDGCHISARMTSKWRTLASTTALSFINNKTHHNSRLSNQDGRSYLRFSNGQDEQRYLQYLDRHSQMTPKVERCAQDLIERIRKESPSLDFELLTPPASQQIRFIPNEYKEFFFDFYLVWKCVGNFEIQRDPSSVCCQIRSIDQKRNWSRAEEARLLLGNPNKKRSVFLNGRGLRDLLFESLHHLDAELIRLDFIENLIYFDLIIPMLSERFVCHLTFSPCIHRTGENEVFIPFGTLRWYSRSLEAPPENSSSIVLQQPLQSVSVRHFISTNDFLDETTKITKKDQQTFARIRTIIRELFSPTTLEHIDSIDVIRAPFELDQTPRSFGFFIPHRIDRNCNVFPAGQNLLEDPRTKRFFREFLRLNLINDTEHHS